MNNILIIILIIILFCILYYCINYELFSNTEDETSCIYVSSHGIKKSCSSITNCIYIKNDLLINFKIPDKPFILVTGDEDKTTPDDFIDKANEILASPNLIHWYSQNLNAIDTKKLSHIPIGLDYHTIAIHKSGYEWWGEKKTPVKQEKFLIDFFNFVVLHSYVKC